jgi:hypothetical protein
MEENIIKKDEKLEQDIGLMIKFVTSKDPGSSGNPRLIAQLIKENFNIECREEDIKDYYNAATWWEDFELESRRHEYGIRM